MPAVSGVTEPLTALVSGRKGECNGGSLDKGAIEMHTIYHLSRLAAYSLLPTVSIV